MNDSSNVAILKTNKKLTAEEQETFRRKFKPLVNISGIMSLCIEANELNVEYNSTQFNLDSFKLLLVELGFPLKLEVVDVA